MSLLRLGQLRSEDLRQLTLSVVPPRLFDYLAAVDSRFAGGPADPATFRAVADPVTGELHLRVPAQRLGLDYCLSLDLEEAGAGQLRLGFIIVNDLTAPRFDIDRMPDGTLTLLGTSTRNIEAELAAMRYGLGPAQVRRGLRLFGEILPRLEALGRRLGHVAIILEPLTYHNATMYEAYGFSYVTGRRRMSRIAEAFQPGGPLHHALDNRTPFRLRDLAATARGRSWAIHDGILRELDGDESLDLLMVRPITRPAS